jgi:WhiB family redox-sensing transcriptional regulator
MPASPRRGADRRDLFTIASLNTLNNLCTTCRLFGMTEISRLPGPVMELWEWQYQGACRDADDTLFFHPEGERGSTRRRRAEAAKAICHSCPVMMQCREQSLRVREPYGVWGGLSEDERAAILAERDKKAKLQAV